MAGAAAVADAAFPGRNGRIAYEGVLGDEHAESYLYSIWPSRPRRRLLIDSGSEPAYSPDGRMVAYATEPGNASEPGHGIAIIRADGDGRGRRITRGLDGAPEWSPGARRIVFERRDAPSPELRIYHRRRTQRLTDGFAPAWSVTGKIAFARQDGIYVIRPDGSGLRRISTIAGSDLDWSPDGRRLVISLYSPRSGEDLATMRADGTGFRWLTRGRPDDKWPSFSPDSTMIAFVRDDRLVVMSSRGARQRTIFKPNDGEPRATDWQPLTRRASR